MWNRHRETPAAAPLPPGPAQPSWLQLLHWIARPIPFMQNCRRRFGDVYTVRFLGYPPLVFISDPEAVQELFRGDTRRLRAGQANQLLRPLLGGNSLILLDAARHRSARKMMTPPFHGERMRAYGEVMRELTDACVDRWPVGRRFPLHPQMQQLTLDVILRTVFGLAEGPHLATLRHRLERLLQLTANPATIFFVNRRGEISAEGLHRALGPLSPIGRFLRLRDRVDRALYAEIASRRQDPATRRDDILSMLLEAEDQDGHRLSDDELRDQMITLLVAGHETTATALCWIFWRLSQHPDVLARVRDELLEVVGDAAVDPDQVRRLEYLSATVRETLRLHPILPMVTRYLTVPQRFGRLSLPAGVVAAPNVYLTHRRPDLWPDPERFDPRRFLDGPARPYHYLPFGGGARTCLGMAFAYYEMTLVVARVLQRVNFHTPPGYTARTVRRSITFAPSRRMPLIVEHRSGDGGSSAR